MTLTEISDHLERYRQKQERIASDERAKLEREEAAFRTSCVSCQRTLRSVVEPMLGKLQAVLAEHGHESVIHPAKEIENTTERTKLKSVEFAAAITVQRAKGDLILRVVASPRTLTISSMIGVPHGNCSSVFYAGSGPLAEAEEVTDRGISDFMISAFPLR